jgi:hypothetical protein
MVHEPVPVPGWAGQWTGLLGSVDGPSIGVGRLAFRAVAEWPQYLCQWRACALLRPVRASVSHDSGTANAYHTATFPGTRRAAPARRFVSHPSSLATAGSSVSVRAGPPFVLLVGRRGWLCFDCGYRAPRLPATARRFVRFVPVLSPARLRPTASLLRTGTSGSMGYRCESFLPNPGPEGTILPPSDVILLSGHDRGLVSPHAGPAAVGSRILIRWRDSSAAMDPITGLLVITVIGIILLLGLFGVCVRAAYLTVRSHSAQETTGDRPVSESEPTACGGAHDDSNREVNDTGGFVFGDA